MTTHEQALEAAQIAFQERYELGCDTDQIELVVSAYLSALLPEDVAGLVERLRQYEGRQWETTACYNGTRDEAASLIQSQAARIAELEAGFSEFADPSNWTVNGRLDPHSGNFDATTFARSLLNGRAQGMSITWHQKVFASADELRKLAKRENDLAAAAEEDGDIGYAELHRRYAAEYREHARLKERSSHD